MEETATDRVTTAVRDRIGDGTYSPGRRLPGQKVLAAEFETNHQSVAAAIRRLRDEGLVYSVPHGGTYVLSERAVVRSTRNRLSRAERTAGRGAFSTDCHAAGLTARTDTDVEHRVADDEIATELGIAPGDEVLVRDRTMYGDDEVLQLATSYLPRDLSDGTAIEHNDTGPGGIYARLEEAGHTLTHFTERVAVGRASEHEARQMKLGAGEPVFRIVRVAYAGDRPVEVNRITATAARYELVYELPAE